MTNASSLPLRGPLGALMFGNFVVACGVMVMPGMLDRLAQDLQVSVPTAGQLLSLAALAMCLGAPLFAAFTSRVDRRLLLTLSLVAVAVGHVACALAPGFPVLLGLRPFSVLGAAVLTPQAAATIALLVPPAQRAAAVTTLFLGWSVASVVAMPMGNLTASFLSWRAGMWLIAVMAVAAALIVWRAVPGGLRVAPLSFDSWRQVARSTRLRRILGTTLLWCAGQFMVLGYITPLLRQHVTPSPALQTALLVLMGASGLAGNVLLTRRIGRIGPDRGARIALALIALGLLLWCLVTRFAPSTLAMVVVILVWGGGSFAFVSAQQARLGVSAPELASASIALNSSSLYAGQALGAAGGGLLLAAFGDGVLAPAAFVTVLAALALCVAADRSSALDRPTPSPA
jgi:predicted MFS family arabinose efflux permease